MKPQGSEVERWAAKSQWPKATAEPRIRLSPALLCFCHVCMLLPRLALPCLALPCLLRRRLFLCALSLRGRGAFRWTESSGAEQQSTEKSRAERSWAARHTHTRTDDEEE
jgi:hypothetical protein